MAQRTKKCCFRRGYSLIDAMIAIVVLAVGVLGSSGYRYYAALDTRKAATRVTAARVALLLCESWRGVEGSDSYDPVACFGSNLAITAIGAPEETDDDDDDYDPEDFTILGSYAIVLNDSSYYATLSWKDVRTGLRALNVVVAWTPWDEGTRSIDNTGKSFELTTYTSL